MNRSSGPSSRDERATLSVTVITWNEEERLGRTLASVRDLADEIVVVDSGSTDGTEAVARGWADRFVVREWEGFGFQKARALELAEGDWVLLLDADEVVSPSLAGDIDGALRAPGHNAGYWIHLQTWMLGRWFGTRGWWREWKLRLARRDRMRMVNPLVHERVEVDGPTDRLEGPLLHYHDRGLAHELHRIDRYSTLAAEQLLDRRGRPPGPWTALARAWTYGLQRYVVQNSFLHGGAGVVDASLRALYGFMKYAKAWERGRRGQPAGESTASALADEAEARKEGL